MCPKAFWRCSGKAAWKSKWTPILHIMWANKCPPSLLMATELVSKQFLHGFINLTIKKFDNFPQNTGYLMIFFLTNQFSLCTSVTTEEFPLPLTGAFSLQAFIFLKLRFSWILSITHFLCIQKKAIIHWWSQLSWLYCSSGVFYSTANAIYSLTQMFSNYLFSIVSIKLGLHCSPTDLTQLMLFESYPFDTPSMPVFS